MVLGGDLLATRGARHAGGRRSRGARAAPSIAVDSKAEPAVVRDVRVPDETWIDAVSYLRGDWRYRALLTLLSRGGQEDFLTGERLDARTALRIGLVHELGDSVDHVVDELLSSGPEAVRAAKKLARTPIQTGEELAQLAAQMRAGAEGQEGLRAFLEKRRPAWR
jgi:hypothetical protein